MSVYTVSPCLMRHDGDNDLSYIRDVLFLFVTSEHKVAIDNNGFVLDIYNNIQDHDGIIHAWLNLMGYKPARFESVPVDLSLLQDEEDKFLTLCKNTKGQHKMIVYSIQNMQCEVDKSNCTTKDGIIIELFDRDGAIDELHTCITVNNYNLYDSIIAGGNVKNSNN